MSHQKSGWLECSKLLVLLGFLIKAGDCLGGQVVAVDATTEWRTNITSESGRVISSLSVSTNERGQIERKTNSYVELATGLNKYLNGVWSSADTTIQISENGNQAAAMNGQHTVRFSANINNWGSIATTMPDGNEMKSHIMGLSYFDPATEQSVIIAELTNSIGQLLPPNQIVYTNAFAGLNADIRYTYSLNGIEQDVILRQKPPMPSAWGLGEWTRLQVWTEFDQTALPAKEVSTNRSGLIDEQLNFGSMMMGRGKSFKIGEVGRVVPVAKHWAVIENRQFLVEEVPMADVNVEIQNLPAAPGNAPNPGSAATNSTQMLLNDLHRTNDVASLHAPRHKVSVHPELLPSKEARQDTGVIRLASADLQVKPGYVLDYALTLNSGLTNFVFQSDTTYFITNAVDVYANVRFEGGAVIKFASNTTAEIIFRSTNGLSVGQTLTNVVTATDLYRPVIFTAKDDNSVGTILSGSTGTPIGYYGSGFSFGGYPSLGANASAVSNLTFRFCEIGLTLGFVGVEGFILQDVQFFRCSSPLSVYEADAVFVRNGLFVQSGTVFDSQPVADGSAEAEFHGEHITVVSCDTFNACDKGYIYLTNSLLVGVSNLDSSGSFALTTNQTVQLSSPSGLFQTQGSGAYYLATNSIYRGIGATNIDASLRAELGQRTTHAPLIYTNVITNSTVLSPAILRDTTTLPDLGYHYAPIDYLISSTVSNCSLTLTNGVVLGYNNSYAVNLLNGSALHSGGSPFAKDVFVHTSLVQEQPTNSYSLSGSTAIVPGATDSARLPLIDLAFTSFDFVNGQTSIFNLTNGGQAVGQLSVKNCEFFAAGTYFKDFQTSSNAVFIFDNNLFDRLGVCQFDIEGQNLIWLQNNYFNGSNCEVYISDLSGSHPPTTNLFVKNNVFDSGAHSDLSGAGDYNGYINGGYTEETYNSHDIVTNLSWQRGELGDLYQPTNSPLANQGNTNADLLGMNFYTTQTNGIPETNSLVDIGYHYAAISLAEQFCSTNLGSIADWCSGTLTTNCSVASGAPFIISESPTNGSWPIACIGSPIAITATPSTLLAGLQQIIVNSEFCGNCTNTVPLSISNIVSFSWLATNTSSGFAASGTNLTAVFTPTNCGSGTIAFTMTYSNNGPCSTSLASGVICNNTNELYLGNENGYCVGMDFTVNSNIMISALGTYDPNLANFSAPATQAQIEYGLGPDFWSSGTPVVISVGIFNVSTSNQVGSTAIFSYSNMLAGAVYTPMGGSIFQDITPISLTPGTYSIVASGYSYVLPPGAPYQGGFRNCDTLFGGPAPGFDGLGGAITLITNGARLGGAGLNSAAAFGFPTDYVSQTEYGGSPRFSAGSFLASAGVGNTTVTLTTNFTVASVVALAPTNATACGAIVLSSNATSQTYIVPIATTGPTNLIILATSCPTLSAGQLPSCWSFNGARTNIVYVNLTATNVYTNICSVGTTSLTNIIQVLAPPVITSQPTNLSVAQGSNAAFSVTATGSAPLHYQWRFNSTNISGATNLSFALSSVVTNNAGNYSVLITNLIGSATSSNALLSVATNLLPTVSIVSPTNLAIFAPLSTNVTILASATAFGGATIQWVKFFADGTNFLGVSVATNGGGYYQIGWKAAPGQTNILTALVMDSLNVSNTSGPVTIVTRSLPSVQITSPTNGQKFVLNAGTATNLTLSATATETGGSITNVSFYSGTNRLGDIASPPFNFTTNFRVGTYTLYVRAYDANGSGGYSAPVNFQVLNTNRPPQLTAEPGQTVYLSTNPVALFASATDDGLPLGSTLLTAWTNLAGGTNVTFDNAVAPTTSAHFWATGTYTLQLSASDSQYTITSNIVFQVMPANLPPFVNAGTNQSVSNIFVPVTLGGYASDDGVPMSIRW